MWSGWSESYLEFWDRIDNPINFTVAAATNIAAIYIITVMSYWWWRLKYSDTNLRPLILSIFLAKAGIWFWTTTTMIQITFLDIPQPLVTLPARIVILCAALTQVYVTTRVKPAPNLLAMADVDATLNE